MKKLNLSRFPDIDNTIQYFQMQYENESGFPIDEQIYFNGELNEDILYEILLNAKAKELLNLCYLNNSTKQICESKAFWLNKPIIKYQDNLPIMLKENIKLEEATIKAYQIIDDITNLFNADFQNDLSYHTEALYKMVLMRLVYEMVLMRLVYETNDFRGTYTKLPFDKYMYQMSFFRDDKEPLTEISLNELKNQIANLLIDMLYKNNKFISLNLTKNIYKFLMTYITVHFKVY